MKNILRLLVISLLITAIIYLLFSLFDKSFAEKTDKNFTEKTGIKVNVVKANADELIERLKNEGENSPAETVDIKLKDDEIIEIDQLKIRSMFTPGHTSDSYSFLMDNYLFSGDTLLINGTGRTDFQNGSSEDAYNSLFNNLLKLPDETLVYPGHDYNGKFSSTIGNEKKFNPRLQVKSVNEYVDIMSKLNLARPKMIESNVSRNIQLGAN